MKVKQVDNTRFDELRLRAAATMGNAPRLQKKAETALQDAGVEIRYRIVASTDMPKGAR